MVSTRVAKDLEKPAVSAPAEDLPARNSSRIRSKISTLLSTGHLLAPGSLPTCDSVAGSASLPKRPTFPAEFGQPRSDLVSAGFLRLIDLHGGDNSSLKTRLTSN